MLIFFHVLCAGIASVATQPTVYDQRQSGKTNVRVEVKDAVIIAVGDGEFGGDYDYNYDYSDLTIKPGPPLSPTKEPPVATSAASKPTTSKSTTLKATTPVTMTTSFDVTQNSPVLLEAENNSIIFPSNKPGNGSSDAVKIPPAHKPGQIPVIILHDLQQKPNNFLPVKTVEKQYIPSSQIRAKASNATVITPEELPTRHCSPGFFLDNHNRCKRIRRPIRERPQLPIGLRFDHKPVTRS